MEVLLFISEFCYGREESSTNPRNIYSLQIEIPRSEASSKSPTAKTPTKFLFERVRLFLI